ncbi:MAG: hypothetical protein R6U40_00720 [Desulfobacterales bacterium]
MAAKNISYNIKAREHLLKGINTLADAVSNLMPKGYHPVSQSSKVGTVSE